MVQLKVRPTRGGCTESINEREEGKGRVHQSHGAQKLSDHLQTHGTNDELRKYLIRAESHSCSVQCFTLYA